MISVYKVPCAKNSIPSSLAASSSKTRMNSLPIILRFFSGSDTPANLFKKRSLASTLIIFKPNLPPKLSITCSASPLRNKPWSTKILVN